MKRRFKTKKGKTVQPVLLVILDGYGLKRKHPYNAITNARAPNAKRFFKTLPWTTLDPSGRAVGLPPHQMGTSEVGHLNIGAGRIVNQDLVRINNAIKEKSFFKNKVLVKAMKAAKGNGKALHLLGLCSDGGVHSHVEHLLALVDLAKAQGVQHVFIHALTDGRDTKPRVAKQFLGLITKHCKKVGLGEIATIGGRYYGMDRDNRWEREALAYDVIVNHKGETYDDYVAAVDAAYKRGEGDEFIKPCMVKTKDYRSPGVLDGDSVFFFNFRQDRARQLSHGFTDHHFNRFERKAVNVRFTTMTSYDETLHVNVAFKPETVRDGLAEWLSKQGLRQYHTAETEKYAHVTYFFNGGREKLFRGEERVMIPSPQVATYDLLPAMSARPVKSSVVNALRSGLYPFVVVNLANADMVGHTGDYKATVEAVEVVDECLSAFETECEAQGYVMLVVADHGNAEEMRGRYQTSHTLNPVPFIIVDAKERYDVTLPKGTHGKLGDVAPSILTIMNVPLPKVMTGRVLVKKKKTVPGGKPAATVATTTHSLPRAKTTAD